MKKIFLFIPFLLGIFVLFPSKAFAQSDYDYIKSFHSDVVFNQDASISITETIDYHFATYEHGIYREIPVDYKTTGAFTRPTKLDINSLSYYEDDDPSQKGNEYETSTDNGYEVLKIGDANTEITGDYTYVIDYKLIYAVNYFSDHDELYLNITGNGWEVPIDVATADITVPGDITDKICYTGASGSTDSYCTFTTLSSNHVTVVSEPLNTYEGLSVAIKMPKGTIADTTNQQRIEYIIANIGILLPIVTLVIMIIFLKSVNRNKKITIIPNYNVPKGFDPLRGGYLYKKGLPNSVITAQLIQLALSGYIKIKQISKKDYEIIKTEKEPPEDEQENLLYSGIFDKSDDVKIKDLSNKFYLTIAKIKNSVEKRLYTEGYLSEAQKQKFNILLGIGIAGIVISFCGFPFFVSNAAIGWFLGLLISSVILLIFSSLIDKKSSEGNKIFYEMEGLKLYINTAEEKRIEFHNDPKKYNGIFETLLPYAIIFGLEKKWAKEFEDIYVEQPDWYEGNFSMFNSYIFISSLGSFGNQVGRYATPTNSRYGFSSSSAGFGGSGFGGGGFSGGGFGGGGGGSW
jgi:uncharacterized membrane protein